MTYIKEFLENPTGLSVSFFVVIMAIKELYELYKWVRGRADDYHHTLSEDEDFHEQVCNMTCTTQRHTQALENIGTSLDQINDRLDSIEKNSIEADERAEKERKADIVANGRATLYHLYETFKEKDTLTTSEYETFKNVADRYLEAGGNGAFKNKIIPDIENKPIKG